VYHEASQSQLFIFSGSVSVWLHYTSVDCSADCSVIPLSSIAKIKVKGFNSCNILKRVRPKIGNKGHFMPIKTMSADQNSLFSSYLGI
jgi:hypothetical protein